jgi:hypothetical protein
LIHQGEPSLTVLGKDEVRINIDALPEECALLQESPAVETAM